MKIRQLIQKQMEIGEEKMKEKKLITAKQMYAINIKLNDKVEELAKFVEPAIMVKPDWSDKDIVINKWDIDFENLLTKPNMESWKASALFDNEWKIIETPAYEKKQK